VSLIVALHAEPESVAVVSARRHEGGRLSIIERQQLETALPPRESVPEGDEEDGSEEQHPVAEEVPQVNLHRLFNEEIESAVASLPAQGVLFEELKLPFDDPKKLDQIVPLEVQDSLPFDTQEFLIQPRVLGKEEENGPYTVLASLIPERLVTTTLERLKKLGAEPKSLAPDCSAVSMLPQLQSELPEHYAYIAITSRTWYLSIFSHGLLEHMAEFSRNDPQYQRDSDVWVEIKRTLRSVEYESQQPISTVYFSGPEALLRSSELELKRTLTPLRLQDWFDFSPAIQEPPHELVWALGLLAAESRQLDAEQLVNFRSGKYAYKPFFKNLKLALREEALYLSFFVGFGLLFLLTKWGVATAHLNEVNAQIETMMQQSLPGEVIVPSEELSLVREKVFALENELSQVSSRSGLTPLSVLRQLSQYVQPTVDVEITRLVIQRGDMSISGTVSENQEIAQLEESLALNRKQFCNAQVNPGGAVPGKNRTSFRAEVEFCK